MHASLAFDHAPLAFNILGNHILSSDISNISSTDSVRRKLSVMVLGSLSKKSTKSYELEYMMLINDTSRVSIQLLERERE